MKNILTGLLLLCLIVNNQPLKGQPLELHSTPFGILIKPVGEQSVEGLYLYRKANNRGKFKQVSLWPAVSAKSVYDQKISFYNKLFVTAGIEPAMADSLWQIYQNGTSLAEQIKNPVFLLATGKAVLDTLVELGKSYQYQLQDGNEQAGSTSRRLFYPETADMPVPRLLTSDGKGPFPHLTWFALGGEDWADFKVYRNSARNQDFELIRPQQLIYRKAESDTIYFQIRDTGLQDEGMWQYYIQAVDIYENKGTATRPVSCLWMPRYSKPAARMLKVIPQEDRRGNLLGWSLYNPERVQSIAIYKSRTAEGPFRKIATVAPSDSTYYDPVAIAMEPNFYYLEINDIGGESSRSAIVHGIVKARTVPEQPQLVRAEAVENGIRISWIQDGPTTSGFYLYRAEGYRDSLVQISGLIEAP